MNKQVSVPSVAGRAGDFGLSDAWTSNSTIIVGKDILELLSSSMYVNPLTIYREYIQNAADAIDQAVEEGSLASVKDGRIDISLNHIGRRVVIRDNGAGLSRDKFVSRLTAFGASPKRSTTARGFRGVGRLAGLGYCQELVFRSRTKGEKKVSELRWDCRALKYYLLDPDFDESLNSIVEQITMTQRIDADDYPERFFEVEIIKPLRIGQDDLLNENIIESYLSQVAPVSFHPDFQFAPTIREYLADTMSPLDEYAVYINGNNMPIFRPFRDEIAYSDTRFASGNSIQFLRIDSQSGGHIAAAGWVMHHDYQGAIPRRRGIRGLRARVGNMQIGNSRIFSDIFPEQRFNSWSIGEVHVLDDRIYPNGRRDNFEPNTHLFNLINHLTPYTRQIAQRCRSSSQIRTRLRSFELAEQRIDELSDLIYQGAVSAQVSTELRKEIDVKMSEISYVVGFGLLDEDTRDELRRRMAELRSRISRLVGAPIHKNRLGGISKGKRRAYQEVFDLIYECSNNSASAKALIDKILFRISNMNG